MKKSVLFIGCACFLSVLVASCTGGKLYERIDTYVKGTHREYVDMKDIITEDWDTLFVFPPTTDLRPQYQKMQDIARRIVFVKGDTVVYQEDEVRVETAHPVTFDIEGYFVVSGQARFRIKREETENSGTVYFLTPADSLQGRQGNGFGTKKGDDIP